MPLPFFLAALLGKAAGGAVAKGLGSKVVVSGAKAGHHHSLIRKIMGKVTEKAVDSTMDSVVSREEKRKSRRG